MTFISTVRFCLENVLCRSLETLSGGLVMVVNNGYYCHIIAISLPSVLQTHEEWSTCLSLKNLGSVMTWGPAGWQTPRWRGVGRSQSWVTTSRKVNVEWFSKPRCGLQWGVDSWRNRSGLHSWIPLIIFQLGFKTGGWTSFSKGFSVYKNQCSLPDLTWNNFLIYIIKL